MAFLDSNGTSYTVIEHPSVATVQLMHEELQKADNASAQQREILIQAEADHKKALDTYNSAKRKLEHTKKELHDAQDVAAKAEVTKSETEEKVRMDTSELQERIVKLNDLNDKLKSTQEKEQAKVQNEALAEGVNETEQEGFIDKVLHSVGM